MKTTGAWARWAGRIDGWSARERVFLFASCALVLAALTDTMVLTPKAAEQKALAARLRAQATELAAQRQRLAALQGSGDTPAARMQRELATAQAERASVDARLAELGRTGEGTGIGLPELMERVLRRHERLVLLQLASAAPAAPKPGVAPTRMVEIGLRGSYPDLAQYVADLEASLPGLRWEELAIARTDAGTELRARVALAGAS